ncbi:unnamed protein product [Pelagomonas calceolata]|jgi:hypothetical protein|uniref:DUF4433 domain-containing protein n=1 Tax=Pelagomonas calceolata TaxID=35677 RepID=A0A8J2SGM4_9STRA|nr:unnamed protein product [Pelagomonas calceolata]|tara:strand:- start:192 stop:917 length:726 start_codon:yes stop_codon:yes gene_type:complete|mmetsp:Transcript_3974/g.11260  ORF Transcript_3974/g.11260 Transcript_3974/m.11260 type:complete len:242 (+) Transcript_3974:98-823(+)
MKSVLLALLTVLPPGAVSLHLPKYTGWFRIDGSMILRRELNAHQSQRDFFGESERVWSQIDNEITRPLDYLTNSPYSQQPKFLFHCTTKQSAKKIAESGVIYASEKSNGGDAFLGDGVYFTAIPANWADPEVVKANNWGWQNIAKYRHRDNAFVRINFDALVNLPWNPEIAFDKKRNANFCVKVPRGDLSVTLPELDAEIWFHPVDHDDEPERFWSAKRGYYAKKQTWKNTRGYAKQKRWY